MSLSKTIGGDRLGAGNKQKVHLHNYERATFNLDKVVRMSMAPGILYPFYQNVALLGDTWDININSLVRTIPTIGPLFGTFKMQIDFFFYPIRLAQGLLHNNPLNLGMETDKIKLPQIEIETDTQKSERNGNNWQINQSSLAAYLGIRGIGAPTWAEQSGEIIWVNPTIKRKFNATTFLAYADIFKSYYANKQEDNAYVIGQELGKEHQEIPDWLINNYLFSFGNNNGQYCYLNWNDNEKQWECNLQFAPTYIKYERFDKDHSALEVNMWLMSRISITTKGKTYKLPELINLEVISDKITITTPSEYEFYGNYVQYHIINNSIFGGDTIVETNTYNETSKLKLIDFPLKNIDDARYIILGHNQPNEALSINEDLNFLPYSQWSGKDTKNRTNNYWPHNGLFIKTYQSDLFNNWVKTDFITGDNGIQEITKIDTTDGLILDELNLMQKVYNMLNRVAISGGTYEDYLEVQYGVSALRLEETPVYIGGYSTEIDFEEVTSNAASNATGEIQNLGSLAGKGINRSPKGGRISYKPKEIGFIMGICSLTPRIDYSQGNKFWETEIETLADFHVPAMDGIGYQDLITEQMAYFDTLILPDGEIIKHSAGKIPAWLNYMTDVNETYGNFADNDETSGQMWMTLNRNYERTNDGIGDLTTYIDPTKYNYAFAVKDLEAQNFWAQIGMNIVARRKMSAKQIPNL
ncbi:major capsid protein [Capybara microvirus Cap1_SP_81]|nr:major capsid protein [Capybara microvirus Cap1_SP_81]